MPVQSEAMPVQLEPFATSYRGAASQAGEVSRLIKANAEWLEPISAGALRRYRDYPRSLSNLRRLGKFAEKAPEEAATYHPFLVRESGEEGRLLGMATVITGQAIVHPKIYKPFRGTDLDYWLTEKALHGEHVATAQALVQKSGELALQRAIYEAEANKSSGDPVPEDLELGDSAPIAVNKAFAVVPVAHRERMRGFYMRNLMPQIEDEAPLRLAIDSERIGDIDVSKGSQLVELYYLEQQVMPPAV